MARSNTCQWGVLYNAGLPHEIWRMRLRVELSQPAFFLSCFMDSRGCLAVCSRLRATWRIVAMASGALSLRMRQASSPKLISRVQCSVFSMAQGDRVFARMRAGSGASLLR